MDPLTQAVWGSTLSNLHLKAKEHHIGTIFIVSMLAGMAPDLDVLIRSSTDPLLFLQYHRQFTHSLIFIPIGAFLCSTVFYWAGVRKRLSFYRTYIFSLLGYGSHGVLDACTSYGTLLLWPFSDKRYAWNNVSIIDPLFTVPLIIALVMIFLQRYDLRKISLIALAYALSYLGMGALQNYRARNFIKTIAIKRGHHPDRIVAKPSFANQILWRTIYESDGYFYIDAVRTGSEVKLFAGQRIRKLSVPRDFPHLEATTRQAQDIERFRWFSRDYLAVDPRDSSFIVDIRYSLVPNSLYALWGIQIDHQKPDNHVQYLAKRQLTKEAKNKFISMLFDR